MARRRKTLTKDDLTHWQAVAATTQPFKPKTAQTRSEPAPTGTRKSDPPEIQKFSIGSARSEPPSSVILAPDPNTPGTRQIDRRIAERLNRGRLRPEAVLDLHGMTADAAHGALLTFIIAEQGSDKRLVLVITGKGRPRPDDASPVMSGKGVLRHSVPHWLAQPVLREKILQVTSAHSRHGGGGALYVYLRRRR